MRTVRETKPYGKCGKTPFYFASWCPTNSISVSELKEVWSLRKGLQVAEYVGELFLGEIASREDPWMADINIRESKVPFKNDTGAVQVYKNIIHREGRLEDVLKSLYGHGEMKLKVVGTLTVKLSYKGQSAVERIFIVRDL